MVVAWVVAGGASALGNAPKVGRYGPCQSACFAQKSQAYQRCRAIPPRDREARESCFRRADAALERCLAGCK